MVKTKVNTLEKKDNTAKQKVQKGKQYFKGVFNELKKVHWPNKKQLLAYTGIVFFAVILVSLILWLFDSVLSILLEMLFKAFA